MHVRTDLGGRAPRYQRGGRCAVECAGQKRECAVYFYLFYWARIYYTPLIARA